MSTNPFAKLSHAYGKATDVPVLLRDLTSPVAKKRKQALFQLGASICHQGTFYSATPEAVRQLVSLLEQPTTPGKDGLLGLLANIATLDEPEQFTLTGFDSRAALRSLPPVWRRSVDAVNAGVGVYRALLGVADAKTRAAAAALLGWLDREASGSLPVVRAALSAEQDSVVRASLMLSAAYLLRATRSTDVTLFEGLTSKERAPVTRVALALAIAHVKAGRVGEEVAPVLQRAAADRSLMKTGMPWLGGNLALFAMRAVAGLKPTDATTEALVLALERDLEGASGVVDLLVRRLFPIVKASKAAPRPRRAKPGEVVRRDVEDDAKLRATVVDARSLTAMQRRLLRAACDRLDGFGDELTATAKARGLPGSLELMERWLAGDAGSERLLDARVGQGTVAAHLIAAVKAQGPARAAQLKAVVKGLGGDRALDAAWEALVSLDGDDVLDVVLDLAWEAGPRAEKALRANVARLEKQGPPTRDEGHSIVHFIGCYVLTGVGLAALALSKKRAAEPIVDRYLQRQYGFQPRVRDALAALPEARRLAWVLSKERDKQEQPAEYFQGAWPYFCAAPSPAVTKRVLQHVSKWKPKDHWGGRREKFADPQLVAYIDALRAAKQDTVACERALEKLRS